MRILSAMALTAFVVVGCEGQPAGPVDGGPAPGNGVQPVPGSGMQPEPGQPPAPGAPNGQGALPDDNDTFDTFGGDDIPPSSAAGESLPPSSPLLPREDEDAADRGQEPDSFSPDLPDPEPRFPDRDPGESGPGGSNDSESEPDR